MKKLLLLIASGLLITGCSYFKSGKKIELIPFLQKDKYGYFDLEGKIVINPQFDYATVFHDGLALVRTSGKERKWGFIDSEGKYVINATYKNATVFQEGLAWVVSENGAPTAIDKKGNVKFTLKQAEKTEIFSEGLAAFSVTDSTETKWGFVDKSGKVVINPQFTSVEKFKDGKCAVENKDEKWGYIDSDGKIIINHQFDDANNFVDGKAVVSLDKKAGIINEEGKYIVNPQFDNMVVDGDEFAINKEDKVGWCDKDGKFTINPQFEEAYPFNDSDLAAVKSGDQYGYINKEGKIMINPQFDMAFPFIDDVALVKTGDKFGIIDKEGKYKVNPQFDNISYDVLFYFSNNDEGTSYMNSAVETDYFDVNSIVKVIDFENIDGLTFNDTFKTIAKKKNKSLNDFSTYQNAHVIFEKKKINDDAKYNFGVIGTAKTYDSYNYDYVLSDEKPIAFAYTIELSGKAYGKTESIKKALIKKLKGYTLVKEGIVEGKENSLYKNSNQYVVVETNETNEVNVYILSKDFKIENYLDRMRDKSKANEDYSNNYDYEYADSSAVVVDTAAVPEDYDYGY